MSNDNLPVHVPATVFSLTFNLDGTKENHNNLQIQYHVPLDMSKETMDEYLDKIFEVVNRRKDFYRLEQLQRSLLEHEAFSVNAKSDLIRIHNQHQEAHINSGKNGRYKPNAKDSQQIMLAKNNVENTETMIKRIRTQIEVTEKKLGVASAANS